MRSHRRQRPGRGGRPAGIARGPGGPKDLRAAESRVRIPIPKGPNPTTFFKDNFLTSRIWSSCKTRSVHLTRCAGIILQLAQLLQVKKLSSKNPILVRIPHGATPGLVLVQFPIRGGGGSGFVSRQGNRFEIGFVLLQWTHQESATSQRTIPRDCLCDLAHRHWPARSERFKWQDMHTFIQL